MDKKILIDKIFAQGKSQGMTDMEVYYSGGSSLNMKVFEKKLDGCKFAESEGLSFRGIYKGKMGYSYTEKVDETSVENLVKNAVENSMILEADDMEEIFAGSPSYTNVDGYNPQLETVKEEDKIKFIMELEAEASKIDKRITAVDECVYGDGCGNTIMSNTKGLYLEDKSNVAYTYVVVVAKEGEQIKTGVAYRAGTDFSKFNPQEMAKEAVEEAVSMLGATSVKSGNYEIIFKNSAAADLLEAFQDIFSAESVQKDLSMLKGKLNQKIGSDKFTVVDDPFMKDGLASKSFDGEGAACKCKKVIDKGVLKTYLYNLKTAKKDGVETTGNASKSSYKSPVDISPSNFYVEKGEKTLEQMIESVKNGILIDNLEGLHAGLNAVSGDFSLSSSGYEIENGKIKRPIEQITVAGNFFEVMQKIDEVGNDLKFGLPGESYIGSPSLKVKNLAVSGE